VRSIASEYRDGLEEGFRPASWLIQTHPRLGGTRSHSSRLDQFTRVRFIIIGIRCALFPIRLADQLGAANPRADFVPTTDRKLPQPFTVLYFGLDEDRDIGVGLPI
jgi:hypothetical protein